MERDRLLVRHFPSCPALLSTPYIGNLLRGLAQEGVELDLAADELDDLLSIGWIKQNARRVHILHFHWTQYQYTFGNWLQSAVMLAKFLTKVAWARHLGYRIVWTMHNYMPHEASYPLLHFLERFALARLAHDVIVHCALGRDLLRKKLLRRKRVHVIPHGDFTVFMPRVPRTVARQDLRITDGQCMLLFFGQVRPYKGVPELLRAFKQVRDDRALLFIAGRPLGPDLEREIRHLAAEDPRVRLMLEYVPEERLCQLLCAADAAVLPYRDILGSGAALTALGFGLPIIAPAIGFFPEIVTPECGLLYEPDGGLQAALQRALALDLGAMRPAALARAACYPWDEMVRAIVRVYRQSAS